MWALAFVGVLIAACASCAKREPTTEPARDPVVLGCASPSTTAVERGDFVVAYCVAPSGKRDGTYLTWDEAGNLRTAGRYRSGYPDGDWVWWRDGGSVERRGRFDAGLALALDHHAESQGSSFEQKRTRARATFTGLLRSRVGEWVELAADGSVVARGMYLAGELIEGQEVDSPFAAGPHGAN